MDTQVTAKAKQWLSDSFDADTRERVKELLEKGNEKELTEAFYKDLEFGTGGLRGIMGVGTNRMNIYTVGMAAQGLANYIKANFKDTEKLKIAVAHDCRNNSRLFAKTVANIFSANRFIAYLFESLRPTPELSYAIRLLKCQGGVVITASHNPKEYNGFKAYWNDGAQLIAPHDTNVIEEVRKISNPNQVKFEPNKEQIVIMGREFDEVYLKELKSLSLSPEAVKNNSDMKIVYTPIHGTGVELVPEVLSSFGFTNIINVPEQDIPDGNFPTVISPNPENAEALKMALEKAEETSAELVMATDPDSDRVGIAVRDLKGEFVLLNGNQTGALLTFYMLKRLQELDKLSGKEYIVKTIVTSDLLFDIARKFGVEYFDVLTGFKYIADIIKRNEGKKTFIVGGEESYGYLAGEFIRDKDAVMACALIAEAAAWAKEQGKSVYELLIDIYVQFGFYKEKLQNVVKKGKEGAEEIQKIMSDLRNNPPKEINNSAVVCIKDYNKSISYNMENNKQEKIELPKSNVLQFTLKDGSKISVRPSGTEPKIKFYVSTKKELNNADEFEKTNLELDKKLDKILEYFNK